MTLYFGHDGMLMYCDKVLAEFLHVAEKIIVLDK